jgi:hypothetical protein
LEKIWGNLGKIREKGEKRFGGVFRIFGCRRNFWDGGVGEADRPVGPRRARDSRRGGRQRCWGGRRWATARVRAVPAGFVARAPRVGEGDGDRGIELSSTGKFENTRDLAGGLLGAKNVTRKGDHDHRCYV